MLWEVPKVALPTSFSSGVQIQNLIMRPYRDLRVKGKSPVQVQTWGKSEHAFIRNSSDTVTLGIHNCKSCNLYITQTHND
jgi:hypothetical protein